MTEVNFFLAEANSFNAFETTYVITHGYQSSSQADWVGDLAQAIRERDPLSNIILTDWSAEADTLYYPSAAEATFDVGNQLGNLLSALPIQSNEINLIGHSLGAHVSGIAGDIYEDITGRSIEFIAGLDPAGPEFEGGLFSGPVPVRERLDASDAKQVVAIHTSETLGYDDRLGDLDLYINPNNFLQPGQSTFVGNHSYAHQLFTELVEGFGHSQSNGQLGGIFDYDDLLYTKGSFDVTTTNSPIFVG